MNILFNFFYNKNNPSLNLKELTFQLNSTLIKMYKFEELLDSSQFTLRVVKDLVEAYTLFDKSQNKVGRLMYM